MQPRTNAGAEANAKAKPKAKGRLPLWAKGVMAGIVLVVPLGAMVMMLAEQANYKIEFVEAEMNGTRYLRPTSRMLSGLTHYRTELLAARAVASEGEAAMGRLEADITAAMKEITEVDAVLSRALLTTTEELGVRGREAAHPLKLDATWKRLREQRRNGGEVAVLLKDADTLIAGVRLLINHVGDTSKLILDPDLDTYYVMDALLLKQPEIVQRIGQVTNQARGLAGKATLDLEDRARLGGDLAVLIAAMEGSKADLDTAFLETGNFNKHADMRLALSPLLDAALSAVDRLATALRQGVVLASQSVRGIEDIEVAGVGARAANVLLWNALFEHEDVMLMSRLSKERAQRVRVNGSAVLVLLLICGLVVLIVRNFRVLARTITTLQSSVNVLSTAVEAIEDHNGAHNEALTRQAAALQETQTTAQEIKQTSHVAAQSAVGILNIVERADTLGRAGETAIEASMQGLQDIRSQFGELAVKIRELNERTAQIGSITQTVKDLADQSNMLALNAAIEAARSGEHGKGFSVVAREIRSLADQSIQATSRVQELLGGIGTAIRQAVSNAESGGLRIESELGQVKQSGESLRELSRIVQESSQSVRQIASAVSEQNAGISQIFTAVTDQNRMMEDTVKRLDDTREATDQVKAASKGLAEVARTMQL